MKAMRKAGITVESVCSVPPLLNWFVLLAAGAEEDVPEASEPVTVVEPVTVTGADEGDVLNGVNEAGSCSTVLTAFVADGGLFKHTREYCHAPYLISSSPRGTTSSTSTYGVLADMGEEEKDGNRPVSC